MIHAYLEMQRRLRPVPLVCGVLVAVAGGMAGARPRGPDPSSADRAIVDAVNAAVWVDVPIAAAASGRCPLERLPAALGALLPHVPAEHRAIVGECVRERLRVRRGLGGFDLGDVIDEESVEPDGRATLTGLFVDRTVDVAIGTALSDEPYPISFDWAVVLDPESHTLFSFVLNCRD